MTDRLDKRIELIQGHQRSREITEKLRSTVDVIIGGDVATFKALCQEDPEAVKNVIDTLMSMIERMQDSNDQLLEYWLSSMDNTDTIMTIIRKTTGK